MLERPFPAAPNQVWGGDITYIAMANGSSLFLAGWLDQQTCVSIGYYFRRIIGGQLAGNMKEELIIVAFKKAYQNRSAKKELIIHSDRNGQYAGNAFRKLIAGNKVIQSMSRADNAYDNAFMEPEF